MLPAVFLPFVSQCWRGDCFDASKDSVPRLAASMLCLDNNFLKWLPGDVGGSDAFHAARSARSTVCSGLGSVSCVIYQSIICGCGLSLLPFWMLVPADVCRSEMH